MKDLEILFVSYRLNFEDFATLRDTIEGLVDSLQEYENLLWVTCAGPRCES